MKFISNLSYSLLFSCFFLIACGGKGKIDIDIPETDTLRAGEYRNPVFTPVLADPSVIRDRESKWFYAYGTQDDWADGKGPRFVPVLKSNDLMKWEIVGSAFTNRPAWKPDGFIWAPDINYVDGKYHLYYSLSTWGDPNPGIGLATADRPEGPFEDEGKIFDSYSIDVPNSIDPFYVEEDGKKYLFWGSFSTASNQGTYAIELASDGKGIKTGATKVKIAAGDFEAVTIHKKDGYYYFLGSKGSCCEGAQSQYHVLVARSQNLLGPYTDRSGRNIVERGNGTLILQGNQQIAGPGHTSNIITDKNGKDWILYHAIDVNQGKLSNGVSRRMLMLDEVVWQDGWPQINRQTPSLGIKKGPEF